MNWSKKLLKKCLLLILTLLVSICVLRRLSVVRPLNASRVSGTKKATKNEFKLNNLTADCKRIIDGDSKEISRVEQVMKKVPKQAITCEDYINFSKDCESFQKRRGYILRALNKNEENFPIAFSVMIYKDIEQFERLLRAIYRPQNSYCIHVDRKSSDIFHRTVQRISACFPNVFLASTLLDVRWGEFSVLEADLICMRDLWRRYKNWKYFINLTGQEFPLRTNNELVEILKSFNGKSIIKGSKPTER